MNLTRALEIINKTADNGSVVMVEYITCDITRGKGGDVKTVIGSKGRTSHDDDVHGTIAILNDRNKYETIRVPLIMKVNGEFVD